ncbi:MAG TPA: LPS assembly lipoprotein LptE [Polyangiaceae bacterium]
MSTWWRAVGLLASFFVAVVQGGCALTSKADALSPRFFSAELQTPASDLSEPEGAPFELRLGQVEAASHLEERMSYRLNGAELGYYEDRRWTEAPEHYLRRALERELFERRHIRRVVSGPGATLEVELTAFEELRLPPARVRLALSYTLHDARQSSLERSLVIERPLADADDPDRAQQVAAALGIALGAAVAEISDQVVRRLPSSAPAAPPASALPRREMSTP